MKYVLILLSLAAAALGVAYALYWATPAARWRRKVVAHLRALAARRDALAAEGGKADAEIARLEADAFRRHLRTIPTDRLADHPGIGPATVEKVKAAGGPFVADILGLKFHEIPDVGQSRAAALMKALVAIQADARARFAAGGCPEAQDFRRAADAIRAADAGRADERARELAALDKARDATAELAATAWQVSFVSYLLRQKQSAAFAAVISRPFPVVVVAPPMVAVPAPPVTPVAPAAPPAPVSLAAKPLPPTDLFHAALTSAPVAAPPPSVPPPPPDRLKAVAGFGLMVAKADGRVAAAERKAVRAYLDETFGHDPATARAIDPTLEEVEKLIPTEGDALHAVRAVVPAGEWPQLLRFADRVAAASGTPNAKERDALARIAVALGLQPVAASPPPIAPPPPPVPAPAPPAVVDHRAVLEIPADAALDVALIRRRYANLTEKLDPTKAAAFGPEFARMAEEKRVAVRAAAEALIAPFGEPLEKPTPPPPADMRDNALLDDVFG